MKNFSFERFCVAVAVGLFLNVVRPPVSSAAAPCDPWVAKMVSVQGAVDVRRAGQTQWIPARLNDLYCGGDQVQVGERSRADLALINQPVVRLDQNTTISLGGIREQRVSWLDLLSGALYFFSRLPRNLEVRTAFVNAGVEGTEGLIVVESNRTLITIFEGTVLASNPIRQSYPCRRPVGDSRAGKSAGLDGCGASARCGALGNPLSSYAQFSPRRVSRRTRMAGDGAEFHRGLHKR